MKKLEEYLKENFKKGIIDHSIRASQSTDGEIVFYIHANEHDSDTLDYKVVGNELKPLRK